MLQFKDPKKELPKEGESVLLKIKDNAVFSYYESYIIGTYMKHYRSMYVLDKDNVFGVYSDPEQNDTYVTIDEVEGWIYLSDLDTIPIK